MIGFVFKRLLARVALLAMAAAVVVLLYAEPGPVGAFQGFIDQLLAMARGDLGVSATQGAPVLSIILDVAPLTLTISGSAMLLALIVGLPLGIIVGVWRGTFIEV